MSNITGMEQWIGQGGAFNNTTSPVLGISGQFGDPILLGVVAIMIVLFAGWKMRITIDLMIVSVITIVGIITKVSLFPSWMFLLFVGIGGGVLVGLGLIKLIRR